MIWYVCIGFLAAFGALCALWVSLGAGLTGAACGRIVLQPDPGREGAAVRRWLWLRELGLVKGRLTVISAQPLDWAKQYPTVEFLTPEQFLSRLAEERES